MTLPNSTGGKNDIVEKVTTWKPIITDNSSDIPTLEEDSSTSEDAHPEDVHLLEAEELSDWEILGVKVKSAARASTTE